VARDGGVGVDGRRHHAVQARGDESFSARAGAASVVAGLQVDVGRAAEQAIAGVLRGYLEGDDFSVVDEVVLVPAFAGDLSGAVENHAADGGVGRGDGDASARQFEGALHPVTVSIGIGHCA